MIVVSYSLFGWLRECIGILAKILFDVGCSSTLAHLNGARNSSKPLFNYYSGACCCCCYCWRCWMIFSFSLSNKLNDRKMSSSNSWHVLGISLVYIWLGFMNLETGALLHVLHFRFQFNQMDNNNNNNRRATVLCFIDFEERIYGVFFS